MKTAFDHRISSIGAARKPPARVPAGPFDLPASPAEPPAAPAAPADLDAVKANMGPSSGLVGRP